MGRVPQSSSCQTEMGSDESYFDTTFPTDVNAVYTRQ